MRHLGSFGTPHEAVDECFGWFGSEIRVHPDLTDLAFIDLFSAMSNPQDGGAAIDALKSMAAVLVHPEDLEEFWRVAKANRQTMEDIASLTGELVGAITQRPTERPSDSSAGPPTIEASSTDDSSSQALRLLEGRPDLQVAVLRAAS